MTTYKMRDASPEEREHCSLCRDGWPIIVGSDGSQQHDLPEPAGMFICFAGPDTMPATEVRDVA